ncbi:hypothetical protein [Mycetocola zhadangensis]|uniref:Uncharacterized protein n=1 Tax=Mycetocola zhadangensis TaxID=1164595 RepID=A0A3L7J0Q4_9MICO|nr:hypothetical protein [Mycetocola zhadangensis]RLQ84010.1 hypothetical protein D9V28_07120 [Mycetocola zhadangensis]GGE96907.1 hypothetical protein GCM10011313_19920 [Mycetocola zhadangensis]
MFGKVKTTASAQTGSAVIDRELPAVDWDAFRVNTEAPPRARAGSSYAEATPRVLVLGEGGGTFDAIVTELSDHGVDTVRASEISSCAASLKENEATGVVLTVDTTSLSDRRTRKEFATTLSSTLHDLLPLLAQPAQVLVLARGTDVSLKSRLDREVVSVITRTSSQATNEYGMNLSINAVDITGDVDAALIAHRAAELFNGREEVLTGEVLDYAEIEGQSIGCALALRFVY